MDAPLAHDPRQLTLPYQLSTRRALAYADAARRWHAVIVTVGASVRELRLLLGWSQQKLADRAVLSQGAISRIESGTNDDLPMRSVVLCLQVLGQAARQLSLTLSPATQALVAMMDPFLGSLLATAVDPQLTTLMHAYHRCTPAQRHAVVAFLHALTDATRDAGASLEEERVPPALSEIGG